MGDYVGAGYRGTETSQDAAAMIAGRAGTLRRLVIDILKKHKKGLTADEAAAILEESVLAIRPRFSELRQDGLIRDCGGRRPNLSTRMAIVWVMNRKKKK